MSSCMYNLSYTWKILLQNLLLFENEPFTIFADGRTPRYGEHNGTIPIKILIVFRGEYKQLFKYEDYLYPSNKSIYLVFVKYKHHELCVYFK